MKKFTRFSPEYHYSLGILKETQIRYELESLGMSFSSV